MIKLSDAMITKTLPYNMAQNPEVQALAFTFSKQVKKIISYCDNCNFFFDLESVSEKMLDYLATDFNVIEYNQGFNIEQKRSLINSAFLNWAKAGTKNAIENVIKIVNPNFNVIEWPEYNGTPGTYKVNIINNQMSDDDLKTALRYIEAKNRKSAHLDFIDVITELKSLFIFSTAYIHTDEVRTLRVNVDNRNYPFMVFTKDNLIVGSDEQTTIIDENGHLIVETPEDTTITTENGRIYAERED